MIETLINGFKKFKTHNYGIKNSEIVKLAKYGQKPEFLMISCSDSRVDPAILFQSKLGQIFSIRNVANLIPPYSSKTDDNSVGAALEFGILDLKIKNIIILGHANCGGIAALKNKLEKNSSNKIYLNKRPSLNSWIDAAVTTFKNLNSIYRTDMTNELIEKESIKISINNLKTFPIIKELINNNELNIYGWWYDMDNGKLFNYEKHTDTFVEVNI